MRVAWHDDRDCARRAGPSPDIFRRLQSIEEGHETITGLVSTRSAEQGCGLGQRLLLHREGCVQIDLGRLDTLMPEAQCNDGTIHAGLQKVHCHGVPQAVNGDPLLSQRGASSRGRRSMLVEQVLHAMNAQTFTPGTWKQVMRS